MQICPFSFALIFNFQPDFRPPGLPNSDQLILTAFPLQNAAHKPCRLFQDHFQFMV